MFRRYKNSYWKIKSIIYFIGSLITVYFILSNFKLVIIIIFIGFIHLIFKKFRVYNIISYERTKAKRGKDGESKVEDILKEVRLDKRLLNNILIENDGLRSQIDHVLITNKGVFNIETKNYKGSITICPSGEWKQTSASGEHSINNFSNQALAHRRTLISIFDEKYKVYDIIAIANKNTEIVGSEYSKVPIIRIDKLKDYIENFNSEVQSFSLDEIKENIELHKISPYKRAIIDSKYFIKNNRVAVSLAIMITLIYFAVINPLPYSLIADINEGVNTDSSTLLESFSLNKKVSIKPINATINIFKISKYIDKVTINLHITNNSKLHSLYLENFTFFVIDNKNRMIETRYSFEDIATQFYSLNPLETKEIVLEVDNKNNLKLKKVIIEFDDVINKKVKKELELGAMI